VPFYEYECKNGHPYSEVRSIFVDLKQTTCPICDEILVQKIGSVGVAFKGSGFYSTDKRK
jgi:putative FmdB family regulatory protein